jgi:hypothetical protein
MLAGFFLKKVVFTFSESGLFFSFSLFFVLTCCKLGALDFIILPVVNYLVELLNQSRHINTFHLTINRFVKIPDLLLRSGSSASGAASLL